MVLLSFSFYGQLARDHITFAMVYFVRAFSQVSSLISDPNSEANDLIVGLSANHHVCERSHKEEVTICDVSIFMVCGSPTSQASQS